MGTGHFVGSYNIRARRRLRYEGEYMNFKRKISTRKKFMLKAVSLRLVHSAVFVDLKRCTCIYVQTENVKSYHFVWFTIQHIKRLITEQKVEIGLHIRFRHSAL